MLSAVQHYPLKVIYTMAGIVAHYYYILQDLIILLENMYDYMMNKKLIDAGNKAIGNMCHWSCFCVE